MTQSEVIATLSKEAKQDKVTNDVLHVFALRQRARHQVTIGGLAQRMKLEGFKYEKSEYAKVLKMMARLGLGELKTDSKGRVIALSNVKATLQSIGQSALDGAGIVRTYKQRNRFSKLPVERRKKVETVNEVSKPTQELAVKTTVSPIGLTVRVNNKTLNISIPEDFNSYDIALMLGKFRDKNVA